MPIQNYIRPMSEIYQNLEVTLQSTRGHLAACVLAPQFDLYRYGHEELPAYKFSTKETKLPFVYNQEIYYDYAIDYSSVVVYAENIQALLAEWENTEESEKIVKDPANMLAVRSKDGNFASTTGNLSTALGRYGVQIGDMLVVTSNTGKERSCIVQDILGITIPSHMETAVGVAEEKKDLVSATAAGTYIGIKDTAYILTVASVEGTTASCWLSDTAGIDYAVRVDLEEGEQTKIGIHGAEITVTGVENLAEGDTISLLCFAESASETEFDGLLLDSMPCSKKETIAKVELRKPYNGIISNNNGIKPPYLVEEDGVVIQEDLAIYIVDNNAYAPFIDGVGNLYIQFRVNLIAPDEDNDKITITSVEDIQKHFGTIDYANDLAMACSVALEGAAGRYIYAIRTAGTDEEAFLKAAKKTETDTSVYNFAAVTPDTDIVHAVMKYNETLCTPQLKRWRRTIGGLEYPGQYVVASQDVNGTALKATFNAIDGDTNSTDNVLLQLDDDNDFDFRNMSYHGTSVTLHVGDKIFLATNGTFYTVRRVLSKTELLLVSGPRTQIDTPQPILVYRADTPKNATEYLQTACMMLGNRRGTLVWTDNAVDSKGHLVANRFLAAYIAGLSSSVVPQQSITRSEVTCVANVSNMYLKYTQHDLDEIARYGCLLVTQETKDAAVYVRHQLTTETDKGLLYYEESCTRNADNIAFAIGDVIEKYVGRANVTRSALTALNDECYSTLYQFTQNATDPLIGPALEYFENLTVTQDAVYKDAVNIEYDLYIPAPMNNIRVYHNVHVATVVL